MLALIAAALFVLAGFHAHFGSVTSVDLVAFGLALVALHLAYPLALPNRRG
jgi:hypothetical protein